MRSLEKFVTADSDYYLYTASTQASRLFLYPVCVGYFKYEPGYSLIRAKYDSFLVMLITRGSVLISDDKGTYEAKSGTAVLLDCYVPHSYKTSSGYEANWLHFDGPLARQMYETIRSSNPTYIIPRNSQTVSKHLDRICNVFRCSETVIEPEISLSIQTILNELLLSKNSTSGESYVNTSLSDTISYINEHFDEDLSLEDLARHCNLSPFYFTRVFSNATGMTPHKYLLTARINSSKFLLKTSDLSIKEVGFKCGFSTESSFCNTFKKFEGLTPSQYKLSLES